MKKILFISLLLLVGLNGIGQIVIETSVEDKIPDNTFSVNIVDKKPTLNENENGFYKYFFTNFNYPKELKGNNIQGIIYFSFTVGEDGLIKDIKIDNSPHKLLSEEAIRVTKECPKWEAGEHGGKKVNTTYTLSMNITLD